MNLQKVAKVKPVYSFPGDDKVHILREEYDEKLGRKVVKEIGIESAQKMLDMADCGADIEFVRQRLKANLAAARSGQYVPDELAFSDQDVILNVPIPETIHEVYQAENKLKAAFAGLDNETKRAFTSYDDFINAISNGEFTQRVVAHLKQTTEKITEKETVTNEEKYDDKTKCCSN